MKHRPGRLSRNAASRLHCHRPFCPSPGPRHRSNTICMKPSTYYYCSLVHRVFSEPSNRTDRMHRILGSQRISLASLLGRPESASPYAVALQSRVATLRTLVLMHALRWCTPIARVAPISTSARSHRRLYMLDELQVGERVRRRIAIVGGSGGRLRRKDASRGHSSWPREKLGSFITLRA